MRHVATPCDLSCRLKGRLYSSPLSSTLSSKPRSCLRTGGHNKKASSFWQERQNPHSLTSGLQKGLYLAAFVSVALNLSIPFQGAASAKPTDYPGQISSAGEEPRRDLGKLIRGAKGKEIQDCSRKCIPTCLRGGEGAPGLGPMTVRKDLIVFKEGFRDRKYCLTECTSVCAISYLGEGAK